MSLSRAVIIAVGLLLAGTALNIAVAMSCALMAAPGNPTPGSEPARWLGRVPDWWPAQSRSRAVYRGIGWKLAEEGAWNRWSATGFVAGWPFPAVRATWGFACQRPPAPLEDLTTHRTIGLGAPRWLARLGFRASEGRIPVDPLWRGAALNSLFYSGVLSLAIGVVPLRRWHRRRHGRCERCGYDLTGLGRAACPECGEGAGRRPAAGGA